MIKKLERKALKENIIDVPIKTILLDMDGVIANFVCAALDACNKATNKNITIEDYPKHEWEISNIYDISVAEFWEIINGTENFWLNIELYPWSYKLWAYLNTYTDNIVISTAPGHDPKCAYEKQIWIKKHFGIDNDKMMIGRKKWLMARPDTLLIDDNTLNCNNFSEYGGNVIQVPSNWNTDNISWELIKKTIDDSGYLEKII